MPGRQLAVGLSLRWFHWPAMDNLLGEPIQLGENPFSLRENFGQCHRGNKNGRVVAHTFFASFSISLAMRALSL